MTYRIDKVAIIGAGTMGGGIAAHLANIGIPVVLLDIVPDLSELKDSPANRQPDCAKFVRPDGQSSSGQLGAQRPGRFNYYRQC
ncbi:MAG: hypothetical protein H6667_01275 [Ardenticatenaceae bacterium]|nr:hypothetical protein [Ardenticatenaceae bacterium]